MSDLVEVEVPADGAALRAGRDRGQRRPVHRLRLRVLSHARRRLHRRRLPARAAATSPTRGSAGRVPHRSLLTTRRSDDHPTGRRRRRPVRRRWSGYAFMGAAHSQAWRSAPGSSTCRCDPGWRRSPVGTPAGSRRRRLVSGGSRPRPLASPSSPATTSTSSTSARRATPTPRSPSPRSRPASTCSARSRWPTRSRRPRRWCGRREGRGAGRTLHGRLHLPARAGDRTGAPARRRGSARDAPPRPGAVPAGLDRGSARRHVVATGQEQGRLRRARRHRRAHHRPGPVHHR